jgi:antitoxin component of MazEF toxin-antitoxin module
MALGKLGKVGNSLVVRIPASIVRALGLREGEALEIIQRHHEIIVRSAEASGLKARLATVVDGKSYGEWAPGPAVGAEIVD